MYLKTKETIKTIEELFPGMVYFLIKETKSDVVYSREQFIDYLENADEINDSRITWPHHDFSFMADNDLVDFANDFIYNITVLFEIHPFVFIKAINAPSEHIYWWAVYGCADLYKPTSTDICHHLRYYQTKGVRCQYKQENLFLDLIWRDRHIEFCVYDDDKKPFCLRDYKMTLPILFVSKEEYDNVLEACSYYEEQESVLLEKVNQKIGSLTK